MIFDRGAVACFNKILENCLLVRLFKRDSKKEDTGDIYSPFFEKFPDRVAVICFNITG